MPGKQDYRTKPRTMILDFLKTKHDGTVSATDILAHFTEQSVSINPATVYRYLNKLTAEGQVLKYTEDATQKSVYQYVGAGHSCKDHIHVQCVRCGKLLHLECDFMHRINDHLRQDHGFILQCDGSILYGVCEQCAKEAPPDQA